MSHNSCLLVPKLHLCQPYRMVNTLVNLIRSSVGLRRVSFNFIVENGNFINSLYEYILIIFLNHALNCHLVNAIFPQDLIKTPFSFQIRPERSLYFKLNQNKVSNLSYQLLKVQLELVTSRAVEKYTKRCTIYNRWTCQTCQKYIDLKEFVTSKVVRSYSFIWSYRGL